MPPTASFASAGVSSASRSRSRAEVLRAEISDVAVLGTLLRPIAFAAVATFSVSEAGLQVTTEADRSVQAIAYASQAIFSRFYFEAPPDQQPPASNASSALDAPPPSLDFDLNLHTLLECLNVFGGAPTGNSFTSKRDQPKDRFARGGSPRWRDDEEEPRTGAFRGPHPGREESKATSMRMSWRGTGYPLILLLEEQDVTTRCELATFEPGYNLGLVYSHEDTQAQAIMTSEYLLDALQSIDRSSCSKVTLLFSNSYTISRGRKRQGRTSSSQSVGLGVTSSADSAGLGQPIFKISSDGDFGTAETEFPNDVSVLEKFTCAKETINSYRWSHFSRLLKALHYSIRASIRVSDTGLLCIQLMMPKGTGQTSGPVSKGGAAGGAGQAAGKAQKDLASAVQGHGFLEFLIAPLDLDEGSVEREEEESREEEDAEDRDETSLEDSNRQGSQLGKRSRDAGDETSFDEDGLSD